MYTQANQKKTVAKTLPLQVCDTHSALSTSIIFLAIPVPKLGSLHTTQPPAHSTTLDCSLAPQPLWSTNSVLFTHNFQLSALHWATQWLLALTLSLAHYLVSLLMYSLSHCFGSLLAVHPLFTVPPLFACFTTVHFWSTVDHQPFGRQLFYVSAHSSNIPGQEPCMFSFPNLPFGEGI